MKSYILNLTTCDVTGSPFAYDYATAAALWNECDELNESLSHHTVTLTETESGSLVLAGEPDGTESLSARLERIRLAHRLEQIADEYGASELPARFLMGEPELNELRACS